MQFQISYRRETGKELLESIRSRVSSKAFSKQFCFIRCRRQHFRVIELRRHSRLTFVENTINNSPKIQSYFLGSDRPFCFISICKFGSYKNAFATINSLSELYFRFRKFILFAQIKKVISMNYGRSTSSWKRWMWVRLDLIPSMRDIYINSNPTPLTKFTGSSRSTDFKDILLWNISKMIMKTVPLTLRIVISYAMKRGIPFWIWWKVSGNWANNMIRISQGRESLCRTNSSVRRNKSKKAGLWESQSGIRVRNLTIWVRSFKIEKL